MNILIDAQLPPGLKSLLTAAGHEARHVAESHYAMQPTMKSGITPFENTWWL